MIIYSMQPASSVVYIMNAQLPTRSDQSRCTWLALPYLGTYFSWNRNISAEQNKLDYLKNTSAETKYKKNDTYHICTYKHIIDNKKDL